MCVAPIMLKNGLTVGCGKCLSCLSVRRNDWSARLQLHSEQFEYMPFFICLTYDNDHLIYGSEDAILYKRDLQLFVKRLKDRYKTYNGKFSYFACGEYGDKFDRPHYHLLLFGLDELHKVFEKSVSQVEDVFRSLWTDKQGNLIGRVDVGIADFGGIHYVTKYVVKDGDDPTGEQKPFVLCSHGIGKNWLSSPDARFIRSHSVDQFRKALDDCPAVDFTSYKTVHETCKDILKYLRPYIMKTTVRLPSGFEVPMPRYYRKALFGSFEHHLDNPFAFYNHIKSLFDATGYFLRHHQYDQEHTTTYAFMSNMMKEYKLKRQKTLTKGVTYESI